MSSTLARITGAIIKYPHLFSPRQVAESGDPRYSCLLILPQNVDWAPIQAAMLAAAANKQLGSDLTKLPSTIREATDEGFPGHYCIGTYAFLDQAPQVSDSELKPILDAKAIFGGCIVDAVVNFRGYTTPKKGISCDIKIVVVRDNVNVTRLDNEPVLEDWFQPVQGAPVATANPAGYAQQQAPQGMPPAQQGPQGGYVQQQDPNQQAYQGGYVQQQQDPNQQAYQGVPTGAPANYVQPQQQNPNQQGAPVFQKPNRSGPFG